MLFPLANTDAWITAKLPFNIRLFAGNISADCSAIIYEWPDIEKTYSKVPNFNTNVDPEEVKAALENLDFVRL